MSMIFLIILPKSKSCNDKTLILTSLEHAKWADDFEKVWPLTWNQTEVKPCDVSLYFCSFLIFDENHWFLWNPSGPQKTTKSLKPIAFIARACRHVSNGPLSTGLKLISAGFGGFGGFAWISWIPKGLHGMSLKLCF